MIISVSRGAVIQASVTAVMMEISGPRMPAVALKERFRLVAQLSFVVRAAVLSEALETAVRLPFRSRHRARYCEAT